MFAPALQSGMVFDLDLLVMGVVAQLIAGLFLASAAGKGRPRHLLVESLGVTPRNLDFLRDAVQARVRGQIGAVFLLAGAALVLAGLLIPGPSDWKWRAGGVVLEAVVAAALLTSMEGYVRGKLRRYLRQHLTQHPFAFEDHLGLTREIGDLFGVRSSGDETLDGYVAKVRAAVGMTMTSSGSHRRVTTRAAVR